MKKRFNLRFLQQLPAHEKRLTISTWFTILRIALTPFIVLSMLAGQWGMAFFLFLVAAVSDTIDGNLARWRNEKTFLGAVLDPIADKILILSVFFTLAFIQSPLFTIPLWFVLLVLFKEMLVIGGAVIVYMVNGHIEIQPTVLGKLSTVLEILFIGWLFACYFFKWWPIKTYYVMLFVMLIVIGRVLLQYVRLGVIQLRQG